MTKKRIAVGVVFLLLLLAGAAYNLILGNVDSTQIGERTFVLTRQSVMSQIGGNVIVYLGGTGTIVVDTQLRPFASSTRSSVDEFSNAGVAIVLITHWHPDHSGGIGAFSKDVDVVAHENVLARLSGPQEGYGLTKPGSYHQFDARSSDSLPTKTIATHLNLSADSEDVNVVHYANAHTDGDLVVYFSDSGVAAVGDLIWPRSFPFVDVHNGGSVAGLEMALMALLDRSKPGDRFIPGHGTTQSFSDVGAYLEMVTNTRLWVEDQMAQGRSLDKIISSGLPQKWNKWSSALVPSSVWIEMIYASSNRD